MNEETNQNLQETLDRLKNATDAGEYVRIKREAEQLIQELSKEEAQKWNEEMKTIKKPRKLSKVEKQRMMMSKLSSTVTAPAQALAVGVSTIEKEAEEPKKPVAAKTVDKPHEPEPKKQEIIADHKPPVLDESSIISSQNIEEGKKKRLAKLKSKRKKERIEDTHTRKTYLVRNDLLERIENVSSGTHGFKIEFINFAIELALAEYEMDDDEE